MNNHSSAFPTTGFPSRQGRGIEIHGKGGALGRIGENAEQSRQDAAPTVYFKSRGKSTLVDISSGSG